MKDSHPATPSDRAAFTLVEILVVMAIIGILASLILAAISRGKTQARIGNARLQMSQIVSAINRYYSTYSRYPLSPAAATSVLPPHVPAPGEDFTYGGTLPDPNGNPFPVNAAGTYQAQNSELIGMVMDLETFSDGSPTLNQKHVRNPQMIKLLEASFAADPASPGVGPDGVYRDPWGNPYIISLDLNSDEKCRDAFYRLRTVSQQQPPGAAGYNGLFNSIDPGGNGDHFQFNGSVMVWSAGPDKKADPATDAIHGANKDNVLSWK